VVGLCQAHRLELPVVKPLPNHAGVQFLLQLASEDQHWRQFAACRRLPTSWWYPIIERQGPRDDPYATPRAICTTCPVRTPCADAGANEPDGMWGGLTPTERRRRRRHNAA
jgi:WhiB family transcriptional regulator, redox-sensing transcriptional regulator